MIHQGLNYNPHTHTSATLLIAAFIAALFTSIASTSADEPSYEQAQKVLTKYCVGCHNPDDPNGDLTLDTFKGLIKGGESGNAMTPGSANSSRLILMVKAKLEPKMPPEGEAAPTDDELQIVADWIDAGAPGPKGESSAPSKIESPKHLSLIHI